MDIPVRMVLERGCGRRKIGKLYLVSDGAFSTCGKLPVELHRCPTCHAGFVLSRTPYMIPEPELLWAGQKCEHLHGDCGACPLRDGHTMGPALLMQIGEQYYPTPGAFGLESMTQGISRRINTIPRGFVLGETYVLLGHVKAVALPLEMGKKPQFRPGIFGVFRPERIEMPVDPAKATEEEIKAYRKRGITPVIDVYEEDAASVPLATLEEIAQPVA